MSAKRNPQTLTAPAARLAAFTAALLYALAATGIAFAFPSDAPVLPHEAEYTECANMVCAMPAKGSPAGSCCCHPEGRDSDEDGSAALHTLRSCSTGQSNEVAFIVKSPEPAPGLLGHPTPVEDPGLPSDGIYRTSFARGHFDLPDKVPI